MKNLKILIVIFISSSIFSCIDTEEKPSEQQRADYQIEKIKEIVLTDKKNGSQENLSDQEDLMKIKRFLADSTNYFPSDLIKSSGQRSTHRIDLIRTADTLTLFLYPTSDPKKIEVGYFEPEDLKIQDKYKEYKRFYINRDILDLTGFVRE